MSEKRDCSREFYRCLEYLKGHHLENRLHLPKGTTAISGWSGFIHKGCFGPGSVYSGVPPLQAGYEWRLSDLLHEDTEATEERKVFLAPGFLSALQNLLTGKSQKERREPSEWESSAPSKPKSSVGNHHSNTVSTLRIISHAPSRRVQLCPSHNTGQKTETRERKR